MTMTVTPAPGVALGAAPAPRRRHVMAVGTLFVIAAGVMLFGALLGGYFEARAAVEGAGEPWPPEAVDLPNAQLAMGYLTLLMSAFTAQWSVSAIRAADRRSMYVAIGLTLVLGLAFVNSLSFAWAQLGLGAGEDAYANSVYAVTVTHVVAVVAAHVLFVVMGFRALGGQFSPRNTDFVTAAAAFWHFTVGAGAVIWWCLWFLEGGP